MSRSSPLPHAYPFALAASDGEGHAVVRLSTGAATEREGTLPPMLAIEALAQGCFVALSTAGESAPRDARLLAVDDACWSADLVRRPLQAADTLRVELIEQRAFGAMNRIRGRLLRDDVEVFVATLTVAIQRESNPLPA